MGTAATASADAPERLVFTVTSGRSGSGLLARLLGLVRGVEARHEPEPRFDRVLEAAIEDAEAARAFWVGEKLPALRAVCSPVYAETSHLVARGFLEPLLALGIVPDLILLSRPPRNAARSMFELDAVPGRSPLGRRFYLPPDAPGVMLQLPDAGNRTDFQVCLWSCLEMERRQVHYARLVGGAGGRVAEVTLAELAAGSGLPRLVAALDLPRLGPLARARHSALRRRHVNEKADIKHRTLTAETAEQEERELIELLGTEA